MSEVSDRLRIYIDYKGLSVSRFEKSIGAANGFVGNISKGISRDKLEKITNQYPDLSRDWLLYGEGDMLKNSVQVNGNGNAVANGNGCAATINSNEVESLKERIKLLERLLEEKERTIQILMSK